MIGMDMIECRVCGEQKPRHKPAQNLCKECERAYMREYNRKNRERLLEHKRDFHKKKRQDLNWVESERKRGREFHHNLRREVMMAYGGMICACCGETEESFLSLDHVNNDGAEHRRTITPNKPGNGKGAAATVYAWLKRNNFPSGYQVLCMNCNHSKARNGGICAHKAKPILKTA